MKTPKTASASGPASVARPFCPGFFAALLAGVISVSWPVGACQAQPAGDDDGAEVLTRGPVHEAFAGVVSYNPEPGIVVGTPPPELIEEIPPEEKPEGDDVAWIPGYWGWDDEQNDYIWISGTWRALPPGREWMAGYWRDTGQGYQWISGYWADTEKRETTYLPPPPETLEVGANIAPPSDDYGWTPGCWIWQESRYAWRAGYWAQGRADWVWVPSYYVWTPRGVIFVEGFWDYPVERRGLLFAPIRYHSRGYARRGYSYSPRIVINVSIFDDCLFLRPNYHHYYFGDYYDSRYERGGFYASFSYQSGRRGYDPFYSHSRWTHRSDRDWDNRFRASYQYRRENVAARPPRIWSAQLTVNINTSSRTDGRTRIAMAAPIEQMATRRDNPVRFQTVDKGDRQKLAQRGRDVQQSRDERRTVEAKAVVATSRTAGAAVEPARVTVRQSPIVARPAGPKGRFQAPPERPQAPKPDPKVQPKAESLGRRPGADQRTAPAGVRPPERNATVPRETKTPPAAEPRANAAREREESQRKARDSQMKARQDEERRAQDANAKAQAEGKSNQPVERRANVPVIRTGEDSPRNAPLAERANAVAKERAESQRKAEEAQQQAERRARADAARAEDEAPRKAPQAQPPAERRERDDAARPEAAPRAPAVEPPRAMPPARVQEAPRIPKEPVGKKQPAPEKPVREKPSQDDDDAKNEKERKRGG